MRGDFRSPFQPLSVSLGSSRTNPLASSFRLALFPDLALPLLALLVVGFGGAAKLSRPTPVGRTLRLALIQPSIPQRLIFNPAESTNRFNAIMRLSRLALAAKPDVLVWPESSLPSFDQEQFERLRRLIIQGHVWAIFGADDVQRRPGATGADAYNYYNAAFLFDPQGRYVATYRKRHLVIFGEYVPLEHWLPFMKYLTPIGGSYDEGRGPVPFVLTHPSAVASVLICFEDVFPELGRESVTRNTDFLLNLTNDGWFGNSAAQWQHAANASFRAIENGVPLVRCTNNGLTCWIDPCGRFHDVGVGEHGNVHAAGFRIVKLPLPPANARPPATFYRRHGDWFGWGCVAVTILGLGFSLLFSLSPRQALT